MEHYKSKSSALEIINTVLLIVLISAVLAIIGVLRDANKRIVSVSEDTTELINGTMTGRIGQPVGQEYQLNRPATHKER